MKPILCALAGLLSVALPVPAMAQTAAPSNALGDCFVAKSTGQDRITFARWMVAAFASAPQVADLVSVPPEKKQDLDKKVASLFTRLLVKDCPAEAKSMNSQALQVAGGALGQIAVQELLSNPQAEAGMEEFVKYLNESDFAPLRK